MLDFKYAERHFLYRDERGSFRSLSVTTKAYGEYFRKLVDPEGGWLALHGRTPSDAFRQTCSGKITRSDHRLLQRAVKELLDDDFLVLGELDEAGQFLPLGRGNYVAIRDWTPAENGMSRSQAKQWFAEREQRAAQYLASLNMADEEAESVHDSGLDTVREDNDSDRERTDTDSSCTDSSASTENPNGTELALFHTIPDLFPPLSPKGESANADESNGFSLQARADDQPPPDEQRLAAQAVSWLNEQRQPPTGFRPDSRDAIRQAKRWLKAGWNWRRVQKALQLRLDALKAAKPEDWRNWATPATLFNRKLARYYEEAQAGHSYRPPGTEADRAAERSQRQLDNARAEHEAEAHQAFDDVLEVVGLVGASGDWHAELPNCLSKTVIREMGWERIVEGNYGLRDAFVQRYVHGGQR